jgi:hypothetical protein
MLSILIECYAVVGEGEAMVVYTALLIRLYVIVYISSEMKARISYYMVAQPHCLFAKSIEVWHVLSRVELIRCWTFLCWFRVEFWIGETRLLEIKNC